MYTPRRSAVWLRGATARSFGDQYCAFWAITTQFWLLFDRGVTAMLRGLHAGLCHVFLVIIVVVLPAKAREYVFTGVGLCVCLCVMSVCDHDN